VYVTGLNNPNRISFGSDGSLYVAEAGTGGTMRTTAAQCEQVAPPLGPVSGGHTARISKVPPGGGTFQVVADGLPSSQYSPTPPLANVVTGLADVQEVGGSLLALQGGTGCSHGLENAVNELVEIGSDGQIRQIANLSAFALANPGAHPSTYDYEPDGLWFQFAKLGDDLYVTETNHQFLVRIRPNGQVELVVDFSAVYGPHTPLGYVGPAGLVAHNGALYVGAMMGYPIIHNRAMVWKVDPDTGRLQVVARRLTNVMGLTFGADGSLYVLENSTRFGFPRAGTGKIVKVSGHKRTTIARGLDLPMGITMGPDHALYVADRGFGFAPGQGRILRIELPS
jgi:hypothetical protein